MTTTKEVASETIETGMTMADLTVMKVVSEVGAAVEEEAGATMEALAEEVEVIMEALVEEALVEEALIEEIPVEEALVEVASVAEGEEEALEIE